MLHYVQHDNVLVPSDYHATRFTFHVSTLIDSSIPIRYDRIYLEYGKLNKELSNDAEGDLSR